MVDRLTPSAIGFGCLNANICVYIANTPPLVEYQQLKVVTPLTQGEIFAIGQQCGNGWRKVFNVYAKLLYALDSTLFSFSTLAPSWQQYRDQYLLQPKSGTALLFSSPDVEIMNLTAQSIHIIMGRTYAKKLIALGELIEPLTWLDEEFAFNRNSRVVVCPYFDYRQLSNIKISKLSEIIKALQ